jgi:selenocysteine-specific elongation factor
MLLVVDVTKGIQTQTAESIVIGDVVAKDMIVVLNKVDLLAEADREKLVTKVLQDLAERRC